MLLCRISFTAGQPPEQHRAFLPAPHLKPTLKYLCSQGPLEVCHFLPLISGKSVLQVQSDAKLPVDPEEYVASFRPELAEAVVAWASGQPFAEAWKRSGTFEVLFLSPLCHRGLRPAYGLCAACK